LTNKNGPPHTYNRQRQCLIKDKFKLGESFGTDCECRGGTVGLVSSGNSLIGGTASDHVGGSGVTALTNGNYVVASFLWDNPAGAIGDASAVTLGYGIGGSVGLVTSANSALGTVHSDAIERFKSCRIKTLPGHRASRISNHPCWNPPALINSYRRNTS
jgi:hypothetical protein